MAGAALSAASQMPAKADASSDKLKRLFAQWDSDGNGDLDFDELAALLRSGDPTMPEMQIRALFTLADKDGSGTVDFDEFVDFISSDSGGFARPNSAPAPATASTDEDSKNLKRIFEKVAGKDHAIDSSEFSKFLKACNLYTKTFNTTDADILFAKACNK